MTESTSVGNIYDDMADDNSREIIDLRERAWLQVDMIENGIKGLGRTLERLASKEVYDVEVAETAAGEFLPIAVANIRLQVEAIKALLPEGE